MTDPTQRVDADARTLITYAACTDACLMVLDADLQSDQGERLQRILDRLTDMGFVTLATVNAQPQRLHGIDDVIGHLRTMFGARVVDAAVGAAEHAASPIEPPHAIIPLTRFEPDRPGDTELKAYGQLSGCDILFEAIATSRKGDAPSSLGHHHPEVSFDPDATGRLIGTMRVPGRAEAYTIQAITLAS